MATTLKSDYEVAIRFKDGGNIEKYVPLEDLNTYISTEEASDITALETMVGTYTPSGADMAADLATVFGTVETASTGLKDIVTTASTGLVDKTTALENAVGTYSGSADIATDLAPLTSKTLTAKTASIESTSDALPEDLIGKSITEPYINEATQAYATLTIPQASTAPGIVVTAKHYGTFPNTSTCEIIKSGTNTPFSLTVLAACSATPPDAEAVFIVANLETDEAGATVTTLAQLLAALNANEDFLFGATAALAGGCTGSEKVGAIGETTFSGGAFGTAMQSSGTDIDATVSEFSSGGTPTYTKTGATIGADITTLWTDVETAGTGIKAVVGTYAGASDISTELAAVLADVGTYAGGADIASDLSAAEGDIDDLEAIAAETGAPTMAVAATKVLTIGTKPAEGAIVTIGTTNYKFRATALGAGAKATGTLDMTADAPHAGDTVISGAQTYTYVTALTEAKATATYTTDTTQPVDGSSVVVNDVTYRFKTTPEQANDVKISAVDADGTLANLVLAINGTGVGDGSDYYTGTAAAAGVVAAGVAAHATVVTADAVGTAANAFLKSATSDPDSHIDVDAGGGGTTFSGGVAAVPNEILVEATSADAIDNLVAAIMDTAGEGTKYSTGTVTQETVVNAARALNTMTVEYAVVGFAGNLYDTAGTMTHGSWGAAKLAGGIDAQAAYDVYDGGDIANSIINLEKAIEDSGTEGTHYGTDTVAHPDVTVTAHDGTTMTITAKVAGVVGNTIALAETLADGSWAGGAGFLTGGVDGTVATAGKMYVNGQNLYVASANTTVSNSNGWKRVLLHYVAPVEIDLSDGTDYTVPTDAPPSIVIVTETDGTDGDIYLPPATGTMNQITISVQHATNDIVVNPSVAPGTDTINLGATLTIAALSTVTLLDYATGKWMAI